MTTIFTIAQHWLAQDPDLETQNELSHLIDNGDRKSVV